MQKVIVVGAGPVGALAALYAAKRGDNVEVYELRDAQVEGLAEADIDLRDPTTTPLNFTKSINLALSERGINSMKQAHCGSLLEDVLAETIPMHGRMIHGRGTTGGLYEEPQEYDARGRFIRAVDRAGLNKRLLDVLEDMPNVSFRFNHKLTGADFNKNIAWFEQQKPVPKGHARCPIQDLSTKREEARATEIAVNFDLLIGADGAHSAARYHMMKFARVTYQQEYIDTLWCEFHIKPTSSDTFAISPNHLHIWPGGSFMFIAIPSLDKSFTCTLFAPSSYFATLSESPSEHLPISFSKNFPGVCPELISPEDLQTQFKENPHLPLISIKCSPYHYKGSVVIVGDASHAMVPFYGQGMNAGLEDVRVLFDFLDRFGVYDEDGTETRKKKRKRALDAYTSHRTPDAHAINDLALHNYEEMSCSVQSPWYRIRKWIEETVNVRLPSLGWSTKYSRISFENQRYSEVERDVARQGRILVGTIGFGLLGLGCLSGYGLLRANRFRSLGQFLAPNAR